MPIPQGLPYDGWYNGNVALMQANGTYADFRPVLEERVKLGKLTPVQLKEYDDAWEKIPLEERKRRRAVVVEDSTPKEQVYHTPKGQVRVLRSVPSENNNAAIAKRAKAKAVAKVKRAPGALTMENNPLAAEPAVSAAPKK